MDFNVKTGEADKLHGACVVVGVFAPRGNCRQPPIVSTRPAAGSCESCSRAVTSIPNVAKPR